MIFTFFENLRQAPERKRRRVAFLISLLFTLIIFTVWITILYPSWNQDQIQAHKADSNLPSPASAMGTAISTGFSAIGDQINEMKSSLSSLATSSINASSTSASTTMQSKTASSSSQN